MGEIVRTGRAEQDLLEIWLTIADDNPDAADRLLDRIGASAERLLSSPLIGRNRSGELRVPGIRSLPVGPYLILYYQDDAENLVIVRVVHSARNLPQLLDE